MDSSKQSSPKFSLFWGPCAWVLIVSFIIGFITIATLWTINPQMFFYLVVATTTASEALNLQQSLYYSQISRFVALGVLFIIVILVSFILFCSKYFKCIAHPYLFCYAAFMKFPEKKHQTIIKAPDVGQVDIQPNTDNQSENEKEKDTR